MLMKKLLLFLLLVNAGCLLFSQSAALTPNVWFRADYPTTSDSSWLDYSANNYYITGPTDPEWELFNFNHSILFDGQHSTFEVPILFNSNELTMIIAYQTDDTLTERGLWSLVDDTLFIALSTQQIFAENSTISYNNVNNTDPIVNSFHRSWQVSEFNPNILYFGGSDALNFKGKLGEIVLFDRQIGKEELHRWQSYLSVKYGITLFNLSYINSVGDTTWHYDQHPEYHTAISGIGRDTIFNLHQKQSTMNDFLSIGIGEIAADNTLNSHIIPEGNFLIWGVDENLFDTPNYTYLIGDQEVITYGHCLMEATGESIRYLPTTVQIDLSERSDLDPSSCILLIDRDHTGNFETNSVEIYESSYIDNNGVVTFSNIYWDTDQSGSDLFRIGFNSLEGTPRNLTDNQEDQNINSNSNSNSYYLYPNPTHGEYYLKVDLAEISDIVVRLVSTDGKTIETQTGKATKEYLFKGILPTKGYYLIEIETTLERKVISIVCQ